MDKERSPGRILVLLWRRHGWLIIGLLWILALILGIIGWSLNAISANEPVRLLDAIYRTLQLIPMNSGDPQAGGVPWPLEAARFLLPFLAAWTAIRGILFLFRDRWQQFLLRFRRGHVIICGLSRKGWILAQGFAMRGDRVVVIEADESHDLIGPCRERGITVLVGDATDPELLRTARLRRARHLIAVTDDDGVNAEIAVRVQGVLAVPGSRGRSGSLTCTVHLVDPQLYELARTRELALEGNAPLRLELFNVFEHGARQMWEANGPKRGANGAAQPGSEPSGGCSAHVLVIGLGRLGECLVIHAARDWHTRLHKSPCGEAGRLRITAVDLEADWKCRALSLRYPQLATVCDLAPLTMDVHGPDLYEGSFLIDAADHPAVSAVFVCFDDDSLGLRTGLALHQRLLHMSAGPTPVIVRMAETGGLARLVDQQGKNQGTRAFATLQVFPLLDSTCTPEEILGGTHERLAHSLHEVYCQQQKALGHTSATNPSLVDWKELPEDLRESNRAEADGLFRHLVALRYTLTPLADWDAAFFRFTDAEVERLAQLEHERWVADMLHRGFRPTDGPKDAAAKLNPALRPWADLSEAGRQTTRDTVRELPATLANAGFQIVRLVHADEPV